MEKIKPFEITRPLVLTANDVFNFTSDQLLPNVQRKFNVNLYLDNHVIEASKNSVNNSDLSEEDLQSFINDIYSFPQIQIPTTIRQNGEKVRLSLPDMINQFQSKILKVIEKQSVIAFEDGDNARINAFQTLSKSIDPQILKKADSANFTLSKDNYTPQKLIPIFNIATAIKLSEMFGFELPENALENEGNFESE